MGENRKPQMKTKTTTSEIIVLAYFCWLIFVILFVGCTIGTTNKTTVNQYPCDTDSTGLHKQNVNIYIDKPKAK